MKVAQWALVNILVYTISCKYRKNVDPYLCSVVKRVKGLHCLRSIRNLPSLPITQSGDSCVPKE